MSAEDISASGSAVQGTAELRQELIDILAPFVRPQEWAGEVADVVLCAGYVRVVEDDETVERVAEAMWRRYWREVPGYGITKDFWRGPARAALQALRGGGVA